MDTLSLTLAPCPTSPAVVPEDHTAHLRALYLPVESADLVWYVVPSPARPGLGAGLGHAA